MDTRENEFFLRTPVALGVLTAIVCVAGFAMVAAWFALLVLEERRTAPRARAAATSCGVCGVVERMREVEPAPGQALEGSRAEGAVILLAALGGASRPNARSARIYETSVIHDDGSVRVLRDTSAPQWKTGDRVRVIKGRVEPAPGPVAAR
ncbi:MAG: hypothetical protein AABM33_12275 [Pseudomonadota bacterium]